MENKENNDLLSKVSNQKDFFRKTSIELGITIDNNTRVKVLEDKISLIDKMKEIGKLNNEQYQSEVNEILRQEKILFDKYTSSLVLSKLLRKYNSISEEDFNFVSLRESLSTSKEDSSDNNLSEEKYKNLSQEDQIKFFFDGHL